MLIQILQFTPEQVENLDPTQKGSIIQLVRFALQVIFLAKTVPATAIPRNRMIPQHGAIPRFETRMSMGRDTVF